MRTLPVRMQRICETTKKVVHFLDGHPGVERVLFPLHPSFPQYDLAKKQMKDAGGLFSIVLKASTLDELEKFCNALKRFYLAVSWGGYESLVIPAAVGFAREQFDATNESHRVIRFYAGLEEADYLIEDLKQALEN
jgi:cystathionine beta-lyase/cystathionine gamma-synthase